MCMPKLTAFLAATAVFASALTLTARADEVHVLNWKGYGADEPWAIAAFEKATGNKVVNDFFNSEQEMLTKLRTNPGLYDVVMINAAFNNQAMAEKLIQPIDVSKIPNYADISPDKANSPMLARDGKVYGVPWVWGLTALAINEKAFETPPTSIAEMWDPAHKGRVTIRDDAVEAVQFGAIATGQNINDIKDMEAVKAKLTSLIPQIKTFWSSENDWNQMVASNQINIGTYWSGSADRAKTHFKLPVSLVIPQEGAVAWLDAFSIPVGSKNVAGAEAFINYMIDPGFYVEWVTKVGAPVSANTKAVAALPEDAFNRKVMGDPAVAKRIQFQAPITDAQREAYLALWQELKVNVK
ncbi:MAG: ABC transporter substrate-binding protein [Mesorhizobium sp.]|uniref:ABC transporter substrate-binding protein n=1 Tax=Mesorhizobium sp. TaxID=1871066 RepID=UPI0012291B45|nr:MAG: ABC transporter substrate-binding protein [Mesorhizobium sp.]TIQ15122.1 MAG: ABC transporter substrate-binding protein [Mesorhizobium sp.]TIR53963.1 MAG: ABC transporter substrate-binding protein [Mesorhizobium sp.]TJW00222.1 MAG: ABC transporter substrate-binding protein [Mesorhizobium sp.]